jgi:hypothetical protein
VTPTCSLEWKRVRQTVHYFAEVQAKILKRETKTRKKEGEGGGKKKEEWAVGGEGEERRLGGGLG